MSRHVVFGTGQVGSHVVAQLVARGIEVTAVSRNGMPQQGATAVAGDARDAGFTTAVCAGADVVYACLNVPDYRRWPEDFPPLQRGVLAGAAAAGARLVVLENLYAYGTPGGRDLVETMAANPTSAKAATRAAMTDELLDAHRAGRAQVTIGRASDYFGPGATKSALGEGVFARALEGRRAQLMGRPDQLHSYSYTPDVAAGLITLGTHDTALGQIWHLPVRETRTTRQVVETVYRLAGTRPRLLAARATTLRLLGVVHPTMREYLHTLYQFDERWVVDDSKFRSTFGVRATNLDDALATTLDWFRDPSTDPTRATAQGAPR
jgi:nucleoside-diphosphate-sugar epimerase